MRPIVTKDDPNGCFQRALPDEPVFTLLARDPDMPRLVRMWADKREQTNPPEDIWDGQAINPDKEAAGIADPRGVYIKVPHPDADKIAHARYVAARAEVWRYENDGKWRQPQAEDKTPALTSRDGALPPESPPWDERGWMPPARHPGAGQDDMALPGRPPEL